MNYKRLSFPKHKTLSGRFVISRGKALIRHPLFMFLTVVGNSFMLLGAVVLYFLEQDISSRPTGFVDALWWSVATVTSVGYANVGPMTTTGKIFGMLLMIFGTALFSAFTALFAAVLLEPEISEVEQEVRHLEQEIHRK